MIPDGIEEWSPKKGQEEWFRNVTSGQRGYKVIREGDALVMLSDFICSKCSGGKVNGRACPSCGGSGLAGITRKLSAEWVPDKEHRPITSAQIAQVCFEADKALCKFIGLPENARKTWIDLHEDKRREWIQEGPTKGIRGEMGKAIREVLARLME